MSTIVTRSGKGVPLTATDHDNNVNNLNTDKVETLADLSITSTATEINLLDGVTATTAELNYVDGVTSNIQTQLGAKLPLAGGTMTGTIAGFTSTGIDDNATGTKLTISDTTITGVGAFTSTSIDATKLSGALPAIDGSALTDLPAGGKVLQVVNSRFNTNTTTTSTSYVTTNHSVTITPTEVDSKIYLSLTSGIPAQSTNRYILVTFYKAATQLSTLYETKYGVNADNLAHPYSMDGEDTHGVLTAITYTVYMRSHDGSNIQYSSTSGAVSLTATEVGA
jgi:hypothetical protein